jgi:hypothetical protein
VKSIPEIGRCDIISDELVQADLITKVKAITTVTNLLLDGTSGVKELQWQGDSFQYPAVRIDLEDNGYVFDEQERCQLYKIEFSIYIFSQERSSKQCSQIKGLLETALTGLGWHGTNANYLRLRLMDSVPAVREDERTWRSQLRYGTKVQTN